MTFQMFFTLAVIGALVGVIATFSAKNAKAGLAVNLVLSVAGAFLGWFAFTQINRTALQVVFAIGGSLLLLWLVRLLKK